MHKPSRKTTVWTAAIIVAIFVFGWLLLFVKPTMPVPKFLRTAPVLSTHTAYYEGIRTMVRGGQTRQVPETTVTEHIAFDPAGTFDEILANAEQELTSAQGWDLGALPKEKVARFYQRSTNTSVTLHMVKGQPQATISQTRFATPSDRVRNWWNKLRG